MEQIALASDKVQALIEGKLVAKVIAVPGKLVNIVVKG
jgi:leucyl-tRNA synthetase